MLRDKSGQRMQTRSNNKGPQTIVQMAVAMRLQTEIVLNYLVARGLHKDLLLGKISDNSAP